MDTATTLGHADPDRRTSARTLISRWVAAADVGLVYAVTVSALGLALSVLPDRMAERFVLDSSTNLVNLRLHPPFVLVVSAFVEPSAWQLWIVAPLVVVYGVIQRWLGRAAVVITAILGHVGATLFVATILAAEIAHGRISLVQARATDVGVSYGLVAGLGLLASHVRKRWAPWYVLGFSVTLAGALVLGRSFTDLGHLCAWAIGLALAVLVTRAQRAVGGAATDVPHLPVDSA